MPSTSYGHVGPRWQSSSGCANCQINVWLDSTRNSAKHLASRRIHHRKIASLLRSYFLAIDPKMPNRRYLLIIPGRRSDSTSFNLHRSYSIEHVEKPFTHVRAEYRAKTMRLISRTVSIS